MSLEAYALFKLLGKLFKENEVFCITFTPDSQYIIFGTNNGQVKMVNLETGDLAWKTKKYRDEARAVDISPNGKLLVARIGKFDRSNRIMVWDITANSIERRYKVRYPPLRCIAFGSLNDIISVGSYGGGIRHFDLQFKNVLKWARVDKGINDMIVSSDRTCLIVGGNKGTIASLEYINLTPIFLVKVFKTAINSIDCSSDLKYICACSSKGEVIVLDYSNGNKIYEIPIDKKNKICKVAITPDNEFLICATNKKIIKIFNLKTGALIRETKIPKLLINCMKISPDGKYLAIGATKKNPLIIYELSNLIYKINE
ncbi:MAG: WD40 repeat domain-containing protein [Promethearchaeota archaeon]